MVIFNLRKAYVTFRHNHHESVEGSLVNAPVRAQKRQVTTYAGMATNALNNFRGPNTTELIE